MKKKKIRCYEIEYASTMFADNKRQNAIYSYEKLNVGDYIVVERRGYGVFIAKVTYAKPDDYVEDYKLAKKYDYWYLQHIDLSDYLEKIRKQEKRKEIEEEMEERLEHVDKKLKLKYYASMDDSFKELYDEYESLKGDD